MNQEQPHAQTLTIRDYFQVVSRRRWTILAAVFLGLLAGAGLSASEAPRYSASSKVLIGIGKPPRNANQRVAPDRLNETQAGLAESPAVARQVLAEARVSDLTPEQFLASSSAKSNPENDLLTFTVSDAKRDRAAVLANEYAAQFIHARRRIDKGVYVRQVGDAFVVAASTRATQTDPQVLRNVFLALALSLIAGIVLAFLREGLDTRVRSGRDILAGLRLPLLGRLPKPARSRLAALTGLVTGRAKGERVAMLADPNGRQAEPFRILRSNIDFFNMEHGARSIMITSALPEEGKSTTAANLAVALARTGRRVILVDTDLRRPSLQRLFELDRSSGLVDAAVGTLDLNGALVPIELDVPAAPANVNGDGHVRNGRPEHLLRVLPAGAAPPSIGEFFASPELAALMQDLKDKADIVIVDGPPLLGTGDGVALAAGVDAIAVVARVHEVRHPDLDELGRALETCRARKLGLILTGVDFEHIYPESPADTPAGDETPEEIVSPLDAGA